jgi:hypothetical protein
MWWEVIALLLWIMPAMAILKVMSQEEYSLGIETAEVVMVLFWPLLCIAVLLGYEFEGDDYED